MIRQTLEPIFPESLLPEAEPFHLVTRITHRGVSVRRAFEIKIHERFQVCAHDLLQLYIK